MCELLLIPHVGSFFFFAVHDVTISVRAHCRPVMSEVQRAQMCSVLNSPTMLGQELSSLSRNELLQEVYHWWRQKTSGSPVSHLVFKRVVIKQSICWNDTSLGNNILMRFFLYAQLACLNKLQHWLWNFRFVSFRFWLLLPYLDVFCDV